MKLDKKGLRGAVIGFAVWVALIVIVALTCLYGPVVIMAVIALLSLAATVSIGYDIGRDGY